MKKKLVCALLCTAMAAVSFTGCGSSSDDSQAKDNNTADDAASGDDAADGDAASDEGENGDSQASAGAGKVYRGNRCAG